MTDWKFCRVFWIISVIGLPLLEGFTIVGGFIFPLSLRACKDH